MDYDVENIFRYHAPKEDQPKRYDYIRQKAKELAYLFVEQMPSRERSLALTKLEESVMWINACIARNE